MVQINNRLLNHFAKYPCPYRKIPLSHFAQFVKYFNDFVIKIYIKQNK